MSTELFLIIYAVGVVINALAAASIWDDLAGDYRLVRVRMAVLAFFVLASVGTWVYLLGYLLVAGVRWLFKRKKTDGQNDN